MTARNPGRKPLSGTFAAPVMNWLKVISHPCVPYRPRCHVGSWAVPGIRDVPSTLVSSTQDLIESFIPNSRSQELPGTGFTPLPLIQPNWLSCYTPRHGEETVVKFSMGKTPSLSKTPRHGEETVVKGPSVPSGPANGNSPPGGSYGPTSISSIISTIRNSFDLRVKLRNSFDLRVKLRNSFDLRVKGEGFIILALFLGGQLSPFRIGLSVLVSGPPSHQSETSSAPFNPEVLADLKCHFAGGLLLRVERDTA
ncbi:hypothetical protein FRX31_032660 [Thalictrum thalictroides]|uniref:Uncharacterized protein n=1 Tax=Thalictrum thalictroides TaxID=46969 RepID=A0A7J6V070_THATH|nr:hypothetical protein FRX31_032660 [Thalictrum thalictroides]